MTGTPSMSSLAKDAALRYLRSAVVLDDKPVRRPEGVAGLITPPEELILAAQSPSDAPDRGESTELERPAIGDRADVGSPAIGGDAETPSRDEASDATDGVLDEEAIVGAFADLGIACAVLTPPVADGPHMRAVTRADIVGPGLAPRSGGRRRDCALDSLVDGRRSDVVEPEDRWCVHLGAGPGVDSRRNRFVELIRRANG